MESNRDLKGKKAEDQSGRWREVGNGPGGRWGGQNTYKGIAHEKGQFITYITGGKHKITHFFQNKALFSQNSLEPFFQGYLQCLFELMFCLNVKVQSTKVCLFKISMSSHKQFTLNV